MIPHRIGIIGYGGFGQFLHRSWESLKQAVIAAAADTDPGRDPGSPLRFYHRWEELAADPDVDIMVIATPPFTHADMACEAMRRGKHVLIEKPMATSLEDARRIIDLRDRTGRVAGVDYMLRFNPLIEALSSLTHSGVFGDLRRAVVENYAQDEILPPSHWFWNRDLSGGIMVEHGVHFFDLINSFTTATPKRVSGMAHGRNESQEDRVLAMVAYDNGLMATHYHAFSRPGFFEHTSIRLVYDLAQVDLQGWIPLAGQITALVNETTAKGLYSLPGFQEMDRMAIKDVPDLSRPEGWGERPPVLDDSGEPVVISGGNTYPVDSYITGSFTATDTKGEVYAASLRGLLADFIHKVENPEHSLRVGLEEGLVSLELALEATISAQADR
ncbi:MAG: Gfo/Idh/MocA family oxidoreductase [Fidelibacterota bacterium]|nr:MAG: Gfo/Idh/MocA family oxidoreductase [Candidatus Neomarinimicrobiota bacterium]